MGLDFDVIYSGSIVDINKLFLLLGSQFILV